MKLTKSKLKEIIREELIKFSSGSTVVVLYQQKTVLMSFIISEMI